MADPYNIKAEVKGDKLIIEVDVSDQVIARAPLSSTGKSKLLASSAGFLDAGLPGVAFSLNVSARKNYGKVNVRVVR